MGAMFSKPDVPSSYNPYTYVPPAPAVSAPASDAVASSAESDKDKDRISAIVRRRSLPDTIQTSWRGVLQTGAWMPQRKSLLGE